jgi:hypothetical protein
MTSTLRAWNEVIEDVSLPADFAAGFMTARPEILRSIARPLDKAETAAVAHAMAVLIETNAELQRHAAEVAERLKQLRGSLKGVRGAVDRLDDLANFRTEDEDEGSSV